VFVSVQNLKESFPNGIQGLIFDCDGVMFDTRDCNVQFYNLILERLGIGPMTRSQEDFVHVATVAESLKHIIPEARWDEIPTARQSVDYVAEIMPLMRVEPGLTELLETLHTMGKRMAVFTNRTNTMELVLEKWNLAQFFFPVMTAQKVKGKPNPEGAFRILEAWDARPEEVVFVGDSTADQQAAAAAGIPFWAFKNSALEAHRHIPDFWSMRQVLMEWDKECRS